MACVGQTFVQAGSEQCWQPREMWYMNASVRYTSFPSPCTAVQLPPSTSYTLRYATPSGLSW